MKNKLAEFEHQYAPINVYCRLRELELSKRDAVDMARYYQNMFYEPLLDALKKRNADKDVRR